MKFLRGKIWQIALAICMLVALMCVTTGANAEAATASITIAGTTCEIIQGDETTYDYFTTTDGTLTALGEEDDKEGTYRISLTDYTIEKVHDGIYNGFFYFGGDHLFATDEYCNVTILDLQGHVVDTLFFVEGTRAAIAN